MLFNNVLCCCKAINNNGNKWLIFDANPKTEFLDVQQILKLPKLNECLKKKLPEWFGYKTIDLFF